MEIVKSIDEIKTKKNIAITFGKFDGLHTGHMLLISELVKAKEEEDMCAVAFSFDVPPARVVQDKPFRMLMTNEEKIHSFDTMGVDYFVEFPFTKETMCMEAYDFLRMLCSKIRIKKIVVGNDFAFGHNRSGNIELLRKCEEVFGYKLFAIDKLKSHGRVISSTLIRGAIAHGDIASANELLGYNYFLHGIVEPGRKIGRTIGIPTVNLYPPENKLLPKFGCYSSRIIIDGKNGRAKYYGITNIGVNPTINDEKKAKVETYIFDFSGDLYGLEITVEILYFIRGEKKFASIDALKDQINSDIETAKKLIS